MKPQAADTPPDRGFLPTVPPSLEPDPRLTAALLATLGVVTVRASLMELATMSCQLNWSINEHGEADDNNNGHSGPDSQFRITMATIVQLKDTPAAETLTRRLDPRRWAFAWRVDARRVAVAEACYQLAHIEHSDDDTALLRQICDAGLQVTSFGTTAAAGGALELAASTDSRDDDGPGASAHRDAAHSDQAGHRARSAPRSAAARQLAVKLPLRWGMLALLLLCLGAAAVFVLAHRQADSMQGETLQLRAQAEATMSTRLGEVLAGGDYGEVQGELETFATLKYFEGAVVTNARRRVVAVAGDVKGVRMGDPVSPEAAKGARLSSLATRGQPTDAELMTWGGVRNPLLAPIASQRTWLIVGFLLSVSAMAAAAWLMVRFRRLA